MKTNKLKYIVGLAVLFGLSSCENFLEEKNLSSSTDVTYLIDEASFEQLVISAYSSTRSVTRQYAINLYGTDIFTRLSRVEGDLPINDYTNLTSDDETVSSLWSAIYTAMAECNAVVSRADNIPGISDETKKLRLAEVKTIRAWYYFILIQHFGGVPLITEEITTIETNFPKEPEENVYNFIISELESAIPALNETTEEFGRVTKGMAQHLLAKVYLTRGYTSFAGPNDFSTAATLAKTVINSEKYQLLDNFADVMDFNNQVNSEVIFSVQFINNAEYNINVNETGSFNGNNKHMTCKFQYDSYPGLSRVSQYGKPSKDLMPTDYFYNLFTEADSREDASITRAIIADEEDAGAGISIGDTVIYFPKIAWTAEQKAGVNYFVFNQEDRFEASSYTNVQFPFLKKFDDPDAPYSDYGEGTRDAFVFRLSETYLIAAEAYMNMNDKASALPFVNKIRERAAKTGFENDMQINENDLTIDFLLDEYARELAGETSRWCELKRTGKLSERAVANNAHVALHNATVDSHYFLRPIPESEILLTNGSLKQNPGYH